MYDVYGVLLKDYIYMGDRLIAEYDHVGSRYLYYTPDQINSTRVVTNDAGTVVYSAAHDPYGGIQQTWVNTFDPTPKFSGKERDEESQLDYFGARYYDRAQYRFISVDPDSNPTGAAANPQLWNIYAYCRNCPIAFIDPNGCASFSINKQGPFYRAYGEAPLGLNLGACGLEKAPMDIKISVDHTGKYSIDVKVNGGIFMANLGDRVWRGLGAWFLCESPLRAWIHESDHLNRVQKYMEKKLKQLESTLQSDKVTDELRQKLWDWYDKKTVDEYWAYDSILGLGTWEEQIYYWSSTIRGDGIRQ